MWSGCYRVPSPTLTGSLVRDMQLIQEVIGAGEIAISDHRSSWPSTQELLGLVTDARVGGMLSGKVGLVHFHTGSAASRLDPLWAVMEASKGAIPITQMLPTHISGRGPGLLQVSFSCLNLLIELVNEISLLCIEPCSSSCPNCIPDFLYHATKFC
jgi:beta-aspartyl-dipeptidase (metallo-type)